MNTDNLILAAKVACYVIAASVVALNAIAPLTKNETDNKILKALGWLSEKLQAFVLPFLNAKTKK